MCQGTATSACVCLLSARAGGLSARLGLHASLIRLQGVGVLAVSQPSQPHSHAAPAPRLQLEHQNAQGCLPSCILVSLESVQQLLLALQHRQAA